MILAMRGFNDSVLEKIHTVLSLISDDRYDLEHIQSEKCLSGLDSTLLLKTTMQQTITSTRLKSVLDELRESTRTWVCVHLTSGVIPFLCQVL